MFYKFRKEGTALPALHFASPTFLLRNKRGAQLADAFSRIAACGFDGLELYGMFGCSAQELADLCRALKLVIVCDHIHYEAFCADTDAILRNARLLGMRFLTIDNIPQHLLPGNAAFAHALKEIERIGKQCRKNGIRLLYHNHGYDLLRRIGPVTTLEMILDTVDPELLGFQPDLGWLCLGGADPAVYLRKYRDRCPIIHFKDYFATATVTLPSPVGLEKRRGGAELGHFEFRPTGYGVVNFPALLPDVLACDPLWITTDHDSAYERDIYDDLALSLRYTRSLFAIHHSDESTQNELEV